MGVYMPNVEMPISGKRYWFPLDNCTAREKSGLFTGEYDRNGLAVLLTKSGEEWHIPVCDLRKKE